MSRAEAVQMTVFARVSAARSRFIEQSILFLDSVGRFRIGGPIVKSNESVMTGASPVNNADESTSSLHIPPLCLLMRHSVAICPAQSLTIQRQR